MKVNPTPTPNPPDPVPAPKRAALDEALSRLPGDYHDANYVIDGMRGHYGDLFTAADEAHVRSVVKPARTVIPPTVGRIVWYWREAKHGKNEQPEAAIVAFVHSDSMVNLHVIDHSGVGCSKSSVVLRQPDDGQPEVDYCEWVPFQKGQARAQEVRAQVDGGLTTANVGSK